MLEAILAPVAVCVTKHMLNHFWPATKSEQKPIVNNTGNIDFIVTYRSYRSDYQYCDYHADGRRASTAQPVSRSRFEYDL